MNTTSQSDDKALWIFMCKIHGVDISQQLKREVKIRKITLIRGDKIPSIRKRLGYKNKISFLNSNWGVEVLETNSDCTYAYGKFYGTYETAKEFFLEELFDELNILSSSQLVYAPRRRTSLISPYKGLYSSGFEMLAYNSEKEGFKKPKERYGRFIPLILDERWRDFCKFSFYENLMKILRGEKNISTKWMKDLRKLAILIGKSQSAIDIPYAFILNMIAIETMLTVQSDRQSEQLPKRVKAFIGWTNNWESESYEERIDSLYKKRCSYIHEGDEKSITINDIIFSDHIVFNILKNIVDNLEIFKSKQDLVDFSKKVEAEDILGIDSKVRPSTTSFTHLHATEFDYEKITH